MILNDEDRMLAEALERFVEAVQAAGHPPRFIDTSSTRYKAAAAAAAAVLGLPVQQIGRWPQPSACSKVVVLDRDGRILLGLRAKFLENGNTWSFPAGFLDVGETPAQAAMRELFEEAAIKIENLRDVPDSIRCFWYSDKAHASRWVIESTWGLVLDGVEGRPSKEMTEWGWFEPRQVQDMLLRGEIAPIESEAVRFAVLKSRSLAPHRWLGVGVED